MQFSNPIDAASFAKESVKVEPAIEGLNIYPSGNYVYFQGVKKGRTTYKVTVDNKFKDIFGQQLDKPATATFKVGSRAAESLFAGRKFCRFRPDGKTGIFDLFDESAVRQSQNLCRYAAGLGSVSAVYAKSIY